MNMGDDFRLCSCIVKDHPHGTGRCDEPPTHRGGICLSCRMWAYHLAIKPKVVYIAGPMTGLPEHNFPAFNAAAKVWRADGWEVINPAEMDDPSKTHAELAAVPPQWYYRRDLTELLKADAIALLPDWQSSTGARGEHYVATWLGLNIYDAITKEVLSA